VGGGHREKKKGKGTEKRMGEKERTEKRKRRGVRREKEESTGKD